MANKSKQRRPQLRAVIAEGELRKDPDWDKFAWALLSYVKQRREASEADTQSGARK